MQISSWHNSVEEHKLLQLAQHMRDSRESDPYTLTIALSYLCAHSNGVEAVKLMLDTTPVDVNRSCASCGNDENSQYYYHSTDRLMPPLHIAIEHDDLDIVRALLQQTKALHKKNGKKRLKRRPVDVNIEGGRPYHSSPLMRATQKATETRHSAVQVEIIKLLLQQQGIDARQADAYGNTPLASACYNGNMDVVRLLLEHDKSLVNYHGDSRLNPPLQLAFYHCRYDVIHHLLNTDELFLEANMVNFTRSDGNTALHLVIFQNRNGGKTPLHTAVRRTNYVEFTTLVLSCDASELTVQDNDGNTPLHLVASSSQSINRVHELCCLITDPDELLIENNQGQTAYDIRRSC